MAFILSAPCKLGISFIIFNLLTKVDNFLSSISLNKVSESKPYSCIFSGDIFFKNSSNNLSKHCGSTSQKTLLVSLLPFLQSNVWTLSCIVEYASLKSPYKGTFILISSVGYLGEVA